MIAAVCGTLAQAACTPAADNTPNPAPGTTVTCSGTTTDQNGPTGYGTGDQTGITIDILDGASVIGTAQGVVVKDATIRNGVGSTIHGTAAAIRATNGAVSVVNSGTITSTASLAIIADGITLTNNAGGVVFSMYDAVSSGLGFLTLDNAGSITSTDGRAANSSGGATVINRLGGTISGLDGIRTEGGPLLVHNSGTISSTSAGVSAILGLADVTLTNDAGGVVSGTLYGVSSSGAMTIDNTGSITGAGVAGLWSGVGATVTNRAGGTISGTNGITANGGAINAQNFGNITGTADTGIYADSNITLTNHAGGVVSGTTYGIQSYRGSITLDNAGSITSGSEYAILAGGGATVINRAGATISSSGYLGIQATGGPLFVENFGSISANFTAINGFRIRDTTVINHAGGVISGVHGIDSNDGVLTLDNAGTITATSGSPVNASVAANVINRAGGTISGSYGINTNLGPLVVHNSGSISATGATRTAVGSGGNVTVTNAATGTITGAASGIRAGFGRSTDVTNAGRITGTTAIGVGAEIDVTLTNQAGGVVFGGTTGVSSNLGSITLDNVGSITSTAGTGVLAGNGATLTNRAGGTISGATGVRTNGGLLMLQNSGSIIGTSIGVMSAGTASIFNSGSISGGAEAIRFTGNGNTLTLAPSSVISGNVIGTGGDTLQLGGTGLARFDVSQLGPMAQYQGFSTLNKIDSSLWALTGTSTYMGTVNVNGGTLAVNGNLASASVLTVNADGTIGGTGTLGITAINGGTLAPGNSIGTLTMSSLTMTAASTYLVEVSGTLSDRIRVTGAATVAGKVIVNPLARLASTTTYVIVNAGTLTGTFESASVTSNFARNARLSYVGNDALLTLDPGMLSPVLPGAATGNQRNVATAIDNALTSGAPLPASFNALFGLGGNDLLRALTQISGETVTGSQQTSFDAANMFLMMMADPFAAGRGDGAPVAVPYADEAMAYAAKRAPTDAFASMLRKAPSMPALQERWNVWAAGFGGSQTTVGNAATGSNNSKSSIFVGAVGVDYWFSPFTVVGISMAGGGTNFSVTGGGTGRSDLFQFGGFIRHTVGATYITAAAAYGWQDITTDRTLTIGGFDQLRANFNANTYSGRVEVGHRFATPWIAGLGLTPYAAFQVTAFDLPSYAESVVAGSNKFALYYSGKTALSPRSELGLRTDKSFAMNDAILTLRSRAAWAHDTNRDRSASATFQSLPGASFIVNGAGLAKHTALTSASAELKWMNGWSVAGTFEGEFSDATTSYAGKGVVRYAW